MSAVHPLIPALRPQATRRVPPAAAALPAGAASDAIIRARLLGRLATQPWWQPATANVFVHEGVVFFQGLYRRQAEREAARRLALDLAGVKAVRDARRPVREWQAMA
jgi:hypothetical protein